MAPYNYFAAAAAKRKAAAAAAGGGAAASAAAALGKFAMAGKTPSQSQSSQQPKKYPIDIGTEAFARFAEQLDSQKEFLDKLADLCKNPYMQTMAGEPAKDVLRLRRQFIKEFLPARDTTVADMDAAARDQQQQELERDEARFGAWAIMKQQAGALYVSLSIIATYCAKNDLDIETVMGCMVAHPTRQGMYTSESVRRSETTIMKWLQKAQPLRPVEALLPEGGSQQQQQLAGLDATQSAAVRSILGAGYGVLQGSAGCGKTRTVSALIDVLCRASSASPPESATGVSVMAAAFTHKAKNCMLDRIKDEAAQVSTVHSLVCRLQNAPPAGGVFLVLDEASMLDVDLLGSLAHAMLSKLTRYQLCFVGDYFQIQPVGRGEVFRMLVESNKNVHNLTKCYRTEFLDLEASYDSLRAGRFPQSSEHFKVVAAADDAAVSAAVRAHIAAEMDSHKIICWQNHHIKMINKWVQEARLAARAVGPDNYRGLFYVRDRVVFVGNNDDPAVTNATNGEVTAATSKGVTVRWDTGATRTYTKTSDVQLSYAVTAHKAQGSEYPQVLVACYDAHKMEHCLDKRWLYTCITRGQRAVKLVCTRQLEHFVTLPLRALPVSDMRF